MTSLIGGLLAMRSLAQVSSLTVATTRCKKPCGRCKRCRLGRCRPKPDRTACGDLGHRECCDGLCCARGDICSHGACVNGQFAVSIVDNAFEPASLQVTAGARVTWTNNGTHNHTVTADDAAFGSGKIPPGERFRHTFDTADIIPYHCNLHQNMNATIIVT